MVTPILFGSPGLLPVVHSFLVRPYKTSSSIRRTARALGFFTLIQSRERPERYGASRRFETMPSSPSSHAREYISAPWAFKVLRKAQAAITLGPA